MRRLLALSLLLLAGCDGASAEDGTRLRVFAASSLTEAVASLGDAFEAAHPPADVAASFSGSQVLRLQIEEGAPADVFASADRRHMDALVEDGLVADAVVLAENELVIVTPEDDSTIQTIEDLPRAERVVIGDPAVPVGRYTGAFLAHGARDLGLAWRRSVESHVVSRETNVRGVRARVEMGEADAAIVYRTDATGVEGLRIVEIPAAQNVAAEYWIGVVARSPRRALARAFVDFAAGAEGQRALATHGFRPRR
ncbi:MAG: molybdate ABC transporter substrate-binding protein [Myxococcales bacterium]|nr:molybdate ABC transporter substrate-binding protein [Myxococcales bacterium]